MIRIDSVLAELDVHVVAQAPGSEDAQILITLQLAGTAMHDTTVERYAITRLHISAHDAEALWIGIEIDIYAMAEADD